MIFEQVKPWIYIFPTCTKISDKIIKMNFVSDELGRPGKLGPKTRGVARSRARPATAPARARVRLTRWPHRSERERRRAELWSPKLAVGEPADEIGRMSMTTSSNYIGWWQERGGRATARCSPSGMADHRHGGGEISPPVSLTSQP
jgi:hypothetical protein